MKIVPVAVSFLVELSHASSPFPSYDEFGVRLIAAVGFGVALLLIRPSGAPAPSNVNGGFVDPAAHPCLGPMSASRYPRPMSLNPPAGAAGASEATSGYGLQHVSSGV